ncbi:putative methyl-CpG-binding domain protein 3-like 3, partial [Otolemur garnettii]|uniref:putative methyl-CpG-binding domain protein 3-like 3 n=1 Tax=Otolemur garnettii TaxID=30611 RepID=UPI000643F889
PPLIGTLKRNMIPLTLQKKQELLIAKTNQRRVLRSELPTRLTSCIFPKPVTRIRSHLDNAVRRRPRDKSLEKPQQLCAYRRLQGPQACSSEGAILSPMDFANTLKIIAPGIPEECLSGAGGGGMHSHPSPIPVPSASSVKRSPGVGAHLSLPPYNQPVTTADIQRQARKVKKARQRLAKALRADRLAREAERGRAEEETLMHK